eukprot:375227-Pyramimonas_sp.AAC.1
MCFAPGGRLGSLWRAFGAVWRPSEALLGSSWGPVGLFWGPSCWAVLEPSSRATRTKYRETGRGSRPGAASLEKTRGELATRPG